MMERGINFNSNPKIGRVPKMTIERRCEEAHNASQTCWISK